MGIGDQFAGLDMENLIGGPLMAAAKASVFLAKSTSEFINQVGFDPGGKARTVLFKYNQKSPDPDGNFSDNEMALEVPMLAIVPIPNLQVDEVNILFDMEVKNSEKSESSSDMSAELQAKIGWGPISITVKGSVSSHSSNTRSSDNSAKYHVDVRAANHGIPEGLARVLDIMAASVSPNLIGSTSTDESGKELQGEAKARNSKLKQLTNEKFRLESSESAAKDTLKSKIIVLKDKAKSEFSKITAKYNDDIVTVNQGNGTYDEKKTKKDSLTSDYETTERDWDGMIASLEAKVDTAADGDGAVPASVTAITTALSEEFIAAVKAKQEVKTASEAVRAKQIEYNDTMIK